MRTIAIGLTGLLVATALSGCCCGSGCGGCTGSPAPYSDGNPYEIGSGNFWGVGYYVEQYGFLRRRYPCPSSISNSAGSYDPGVMQNSAPAQDPIAPVPAVPTPYDPRSEAIPVPSSAS
jgi:hypothetical protein